MSSLNKIILIGKVVSEAELRSTNDGDSVTNFTLRVTRPSAPGVSSSASDDLRIVAWRDHAQRAQAFRNDMMVYVEGRIVTRTYDDEDGRRHWITEVEARDIQSLESMGSDETSPETQFEAPAFGEKSPLESPANAPLEEKKVAAPDFDFSEAGTQAKPTDVPAEDIPF